MAVPSEEGTLDVTAYHERMTNAAKMGNISSADKIMSPYYTFFKSLLEWAAF
jgi:hypothetical protein